MTSIGVFANIIQNGRILCIKKNYPPYEWSIPGGMLEKKESPIEAVKREVYEETKLIVKIESFIGVYAAIYNDDIMLSFLASIEEKEPWHSNNEIEKKGFFAKDNLPNPIAYSTILRIHDAFDKKSNVFRVLIHPKEHEDNITL
jgi:8-oxo-dGTP diphosphatase